MTWVTAYIGLGSNLSDPIVQIHRGLDALRRLPHCIFLTHSPLYSSPPLPVPGLPLQPDFINAVAALQTTLTAQTLLEVLQQIETSQGRQRTVIWGPRTLDLDLLLFGDQQCCGSTLTLPHPGLTQRRFVLRPLLDLAPDLCLPNGTPIQDYLESSMPLLLKSVNGASNKQSCD